MHLVDFHTASIFHCCILCRQIFVYLAVGLFVGWLFFFFFFHLLHFSVEFQNDQLVPEQFSLAVLEPSYIMIKKIIGITEMDSFQDRGVISIQNVNGGVTLKMKSSCSLRPFSGQF